MIITKKLTNAPIMENARNVDTRNIYNTDKIQLKSKSVGKKDKRRRMSPFGYLFRFISWWFGFTGLYTMFAVCPFCGQQGCPVGLASAGTFGALCALCVQDWKRFFTFIKHRMSK